MRPPVSRPVATIVRDCRGVLCSSCGAVEPAAVKLAQTHGFLAFCRDCSRRVGAASERLATTNRHETEG